MEPCETSMENDLSTSVAQIGLIDAQKTTKNHPSQRSCYKVLKLFNLFDGARLFLPPFLLAVNSFVILSILLLRINFSLVYLETRAQW